MCYQISDLIFDKLHFSHQTTKKKLPKLKLKWAIEMKHVFSQHFIELTKCYTCTADAFYPRGHFFVHINQCFFFVVIFFGV